MEEGEQMVKLMDKIADTLEKAEKGEVKIPKDKKSGGKVYVYFYREEAYRTDGDGNKVPDGGDSRGNLERIAKNLGFPEVVDNPQLLADILEAMTEDLDSGILAYKKGSVPAPTVEAPAEEPEEEEEDEEVDDEEEDEDEDEVDEEEEDDD
jgi:ribosomal protein L12E/L44/L45/RPP1/RPP2